MHFRQRLAWLLVMFYLAATCAVVYYIFEINDSYNIYALDHVERFHNADDADAGRSALHSLWHVADIPLAAWLAISFMPYLQVFCMLMACTKPEPRLSLAFLWPIYLYLRCQRACRWGDNAPKSVNMPYQNGHTLIDT